jgi:hypothetical protein
MKKTNNMKTILPIAAFAGTIGKANSKPAIFI